MAHLTPDQIERYASRSGSVDEILAVAEHFEVCSDCRDRAAALIDPGDNEVSHTRKEHRVSGARPALQYIGRKRVAGKPLLWWLLGAAAMIVILLVILGHR